MLLKVSRRDVTWQSTGLISFAIRKSPQVQSFVEEAIQQPSNEQRAYLFVNQSLPAGLGKDPQAWTPLSPTRTGTQNYQNVMISNLRKCGKAIFRLHWLSFADPFYLSGILFNIEASQP